MTTQADVNDLLARPEPKPIKRDRYGRYLLPHPDTGKEQAWTRATTVSDTLADRFGLEQWAQRNVAFGIGQRPDLYAQACAATLDDKETLNGIVRQAQEAAASQSRANLGSALHQFAERYERGEIGLDQIPQPWRADVEAYVTTMAAAGIAPLDGWIERVVVVPDVNGEDVAGTCDRLTNAMEWALPRIADLKTGKDVLQYSMGDIAQQLAIYAHATHWYDQMTGELVPMPKVDQSKALVMHLPVGQATCTLIEVDIEAGWEAVQLAVEVRKWRRRKDLGEVVPIVGSGGVSPASPEPTSSEPEEGSTPTAPTSGSEPREVDIKLYGKNVGEGYRAGVWSENDQERFGLTYYGRPTVMCYGLDYFKPAEVLEKTAERFYFDAGSNGRPIYATYDELKRVFEALGLLPEEERTLSEIFEAEDAAKALFIQRLAWLRSRVKRIVDEGLADVLAGIWSERDDIPTFRQGGPRNDEEIDFVAGACSLVEMGVGMEFFDPDPAVKAKKPGSAA